MKSRIYFLIVPFLVLTCTVFGQSLSLSPTSPIPNIVTITAVNAGELPSNPNVNNSSQSLVYKFKKLGGWGSVDLGAVDVICWWLPNGIRVKVNADNNSGPGQKNGIASPAVTLYKSPNNYQNFIHDIQTTSQVSRVITMSVEVSDFSALAIGLYDVTIQYRLNY